MTTLDPLLERQLSKLGLTDGVAPDPAQFAELLQRVSQTYGRSSEQRDQLARMLEMSKETAQSAMGERDRVGEVLVAVGDALSALSAIARDPAIPASGVSTPREEALTPLEGAVAPTPVELFASARRSWSRYLTELLDSDELTEGESSIVQASRALNRGYVAMADALGHALSALHAERRLQHELELAQRLVTPPGDAAQTAFLEVVAASEPAGTCGGDFWGMYPLSDPAIGPSEADLFGPSAPELPTERIAVLVGDVTGHGVPSTMVVGAVRAACEQVRGSPNATLATFFERANRAVHHVGRGQLMMTCVGALFDPARRELVVGNAGHRLPLMLRGGEAHPVVVRGSPLGAAPHPDCEYVTLPFFSDDIVCFYTDGVVETEDGFGARFTERRLRSALGGHYDRDPRNMRDGMLAELRAFRGDRSRADDLTIVLARVRADAEDPWSSIR